MACISVTCLCIHLFISFLSVRSILVNIFYEVNIDKCHCLWDNRYSEYRTQNLLFGMLYFARLVNFALITITDMPDACIFVFVNKLAESIDKIVFDFLQQKIKRLEFEV